MTPQEIFKLIEPELREVEQELKTYIASDIPMIFHIGRYIQDSGGKRIRPALLLLVAKFCHYAGGDTIKLGAAVEMVHSATLVHDDIIDDAKVRRGQPSVNAAWGNEITVLMGDWLYATSMKLTLGRRNFRILDALVDATQQMIEGELIQLSINGRINVTEEQQLDISRRKTAYLFAACARIGGILGRVSKEEEDALANFGLNTGMAFQLIDDVLDFTSNEETLGKPVVNDLKEGKLTLPLIYLIETGEKEPLETIHALLRDDSFGLLCREKIVRLVKEYKTLDRTRSKAYRYAEMAKESLNIFPDSRIKQALLSIPNLIVERDR